jgi:hypothetical protein
MSDIDYQLIIKWVIIVIVAGFLGQFGKTFATYLIEKARKKKANVASESLRSTVNQPPEPSSPITIPEMTGTEDKAKKKELKASVKMRKKENKELS